MFGIADTNLLARGELFVDPGAAAAAAKLEGIAADSRCGQGGHPVVADSGRDGLAYTTTGDRFVGHRREFPWLDGSDDAVLEPRAGRRGEVFLRHVTLEPKAEWDKSIREELDLLVQQGLSRRVEVLGRYWSCPDPRRPRHDPVRGPLCYCRWPRTGRLVCDQHGLEMRDLGPRSRGGPAEGHAGRQRTAPLHRRPGPARAGRTVPGGDRPVPVPWRCGATPG